MAALEILCGIAAICFLFYYYCTSQFGFWKQRGVVGPEPSFPFGTTKDIIAGKLSIGVQMKEWYEEYKGERMIGIFMRGKPAMVLRDRELIKDVIIKDFTTFPNRGIKYNTRVDPMSQNLVFVDEKEWRPLRRKLSPVFTSGKLKQMFYLLVECGDDLDKYLDQLAERNEPIECRDITAKYTTEVISTCAFGLKTNTIADGDNEFRKLGNREFQMTLKKVLQHLIRDTAPWLYSIVGSLLIDWESVRFFTNCLMDTIATRKQNKIVRHDFVDLLIEMKENSTDMTDIEITDNLLTAQALVFFTAGFETSSIAMTNALFELSLNLDIQEKLRQEMKEEIKKQDGKLTYEAVQNMKYLDKVFKETLRKFPPAAIVLRESVRPYTFRNTNITIPKGVQIFISIPGIHRNPELYPSPETFDPERFSDEAVAARHPMDYIPFGDGPRNCIGSRFAIYQTKVGLIKFLLRHKVVMSEKTKVPYEYDRKSGILAPRGGVYVNISKISE